MIQFTKNGQGFWDFDFEFLKENTSEEFAELVKEELSFNSSKIIDVVVDDDLASVGYINIYVFKSYHVVNLSYFNKVGSSRRDVLTSHAIKMAYKHMQKLGVIND